MNKTYATNRDRTSDLKIFSLTLSQLSYRGLLGDGQPDSYQYELHTCYILTQVFAHIQETVKLRETVSKYNQYTHIHTQILTHTHTNAVETQPYTSNNRTCPNTNIYKHTT